MISIMGWRNSISICIVALFLCATVASSMGTGNTTCEPTATECPDAFSNTLLGCCTLPNAVCCQQPLPTGLKRNFCCPAGSQCSSEGCTPVEHKYSCGPAQGRNCTESYVCAPGPLPWIPTPNKSNIVVMGDSVSIGWTPVLATKLASRSYVTHSPASGDGGARSTTDALQCMPYRIQTSTLEPLPLSESDFFLFNFGLHDYNLGLAGANEYETELTAIVANITTKVTKPKFVFISTTPAHNTGNTADEVTVVELNKRATVVMSKFNIPYVDIHTPILAKCGPVPWADSGPNACSLCAPNCQSLSVHYTATGYDFISGLIIDALKLNVAI